MAIVDAPRPSAREILSRTVDKPPFRVPSMVEIAAVPPNGLVTASLFAGCGGSSLGYRMAGFKVLYANEFIEAARDSYRANAAYGTVIDGRDIRQIAPEDILRATGIGVGDLDVLDGSPPCAAFSTAGLKDGSWNKVRKYSSTSQRTDDLFLEYIRIVDGLRPKVFVAENVSGLVKGVSRGQFIEIIKGMKALGYTVEARVLDAQWLGVPQTRARLFFVGVRSDLGKAPAFPKPLPYRYALADACPAIVAQGDNAGFGAGRMRSARHHPSGTIGASTATGNGRFPPSVVDALVDGVGPGIERRKLTIPELRRICGFPDDFLLAGTHAQQYERLGRAVPPVVMCHLASAVRDGVFGRSPGVAAGSRQGRRRIAAG